MSSSNRSPEPLNGIILRDHRPVGALQLPENHRDAFIERFNRQYASLGLRLEAMPAETEPPSQA